MFRFSRLGAAILAVLSMLLVTAPVVSAHAADTDGGGVCSGDVKIVLFDNWGQAGADDDFCFFAYAGFYLLPYQQDPNFNSNDAQSATIPADDVGNRYSMNCCVSSVSVINNSGVALCIRWYENTNYGTNGDYDSLVLSNTHAHWDFWINNDWYKSMRVYMKYNADGQLVKDSGC